MKVLFVVTSHDHIDDQRPTGVYFKEFGVPYRRIKEKGYEIVVASPKGGKAPIDPKSLPDPEEWQEEVSALENTIPLDQVTSESFDALFLPGGHGTMFDLPQNESLQRLLSDLDASQKVIAAVCHGPAGLVGAVKKDGTPLVKGKRVTSFTNDEERAAQLDQQMPFLLESKLRELGAEFIGKPNFTEHVEQDGNLITGQNPQSSEKIVQLVLKALEERNSLSS